MSLPWVPDAEFDDGPALGGVFGDPGWTPLSSRRLDDGVKRGRTDLEVVKGGHTIAGGKVCVHPLGLHPEIAMPAGHEVGHCLVFDEAWRHMPIDIMNERLSGAVFPSPAEVRALRKAYEGVARVHDWPVPSLVR